MSTALGGRIPSTARSAPGILRWDGPGIWRSQQGACGLGSEWEHGGAIGASSASSGQQQHADLGEGASQGGDEGLHPRAMRKQHHPAGNVRMTLHTRIREQRKVRRITDLPEGWAIPPHK